MPETAEEALPLPSRRERVRALRTVLARTYRADRMRTILALVPGWPLAGLAVAVAGRSLVDAHDADQVGRVVGAAAVAGAATVVAAVIGYWQSANGLLRMAQVISAEIDTMLLDHLGTVATVEPFDDPDLLDRVEILRIGREPLVNVLAVAGGLIGTLTGALVSALLLASVEPWLAVMPLLVLPVGAVYFRTERASSEAERRVAEARRTALHLYDVGTGPAEGKELRALGHVDVLLDRHDATWAEIDDQLSAVAVRGLVLRLAAWTAYCSVLAVALVVALSSASERGELAGPSLFVLALATGQLVFVAFNGAFVATGVRNAADIAGHLVAVVGDPGATPTAEPDRRRPPDRIADAVVVEQATYRYPGADHDALGPVDLALPAGSVTALVGPNGAGKSTLVSLLLGLRPPTTGAVTVDATDLRHMVDGAWYERAAVVCQDFVRFELPVREGVGAGDLPRLGDTPAVERALERADARRMVALLPDDLDTRVGSHFGGRELSGGQWQRLAVSRGLMREAPLLLVLDEPTVSMDAITEQALLERCVADARRLAASSGTVVVFVSHRYATARLADQIVVVDEGRVLERGTHAELMVDGGRYAEVYRRQADAYRR